MAYWDSIVRIQGPRVVGTGCFIRQNLVVTAAHVLLPRIRDGWSDEDTQNTTVHTIFGLPYHPTARNVFFLEGWLNSREPANDMCLVSVPPLLTAGLKFRKYFGEADDSYEVAVLGYPASDQGSINPHYDMGMVKRQGAYLRSAGFRWPEGVSGAPFLIEEEQGGVEVVGIVTATPTDTDEEVSVGLPLLDINFGRLLAQANETIS